LVSAAHAISAEVRLYDHLFLKANPGEEDEDFRSSLNPNSLEVLTGCRVEPSLMDAMPGHQCQFERLGYFSVDPDSKKGRLVFNRAVTLVDPWAKIAKAEHKQ